MIDDVTKALIENDITIATGVPDGYLVPLIKELEDSPKIDYITAAREEECFGIASGAVMSGKRTLVLMQNSGFLNSIGCFSTLCQSYQVPFVCLIANRGNINDGNSYDPNKYRSYMATLKALNLFYIASSWQDLPTNISKAVKRADGGREPVFINIEEPLSQTETC